MVLNKFLETPAPPDARFVASVENVLQKLLQIARSEELGYPFREGTPRVAPVEFVMTCAFTGYNSAQREDILTND